MNAILETKALTKLYPLRGGGRRFVHAVDGIDLAVGEGECVGLVGESGCGKSTLARLVARLIDPTSGTITFDRVDISALPLRAFGASKARAAVQMVFQDPTESLNPSFTAFKAVAEPIQRLTGEHNPTALADRVHAAFDDVGLPHDLARRYPHQLSVGQKARVGIARAIAVRPRLLILDEPTSALDASVQSVVLKLLGHLRDKHRMSYLFVSHDLEVVRLLCDRIVVMYLGRVVEDAPTRALLANPLHPYTSALLAASPDPARKGQRISRVEGAAASAVDPNPSACRFAPCCPMEIEECRRVSPQLLAFGPHRAVACHRAKIMRQSIDGPRTVPAGSSRL